MYLRAFHQFSRLKRCLKKVRLIAGKQFPEGVDDHVEDEIYAFFLNCHHLKDWVAEDKALKIEKAAIESLIDRTECLKICADLANAQKHGGLDPEKRPKRKPMPIITPDFIYPITVQFNLRVQPARLGLDAKIQSDRGEYDYLKLAEDCFSSWLQFLRANGVPKTFFED